MKFLSLAKDLIIIILAALLIAFVLQAFVFDTRIVPTGSMEPTINKNDRFFNFKLAYLFSGPRRGDIVVFSPPAELGESDDLLKRVIGLPGETVEVKDHKVYINDEPLDEPYLVVLPDYTFGPVTVPEGCYFMLGDNRNSSVDSHLWDDPFVARKNIKGKIVLRFWPRENFGKVK
ncbi:MAG: signal peptidase I [Clostridiales bacterium]|nr:signal peptidase I [Clostridiales bacterium]